MDVLKKEFKPYRGCFIFLGVIILIGIFFGIIGILEPIIGGFSVLPALAVASFAIFFWVSLAKGVRWAKTVAGILLLIIGLGLTAFILYDFVTSLIKGQSLLKTSAIDAGNYGTSVFIILIFSLGIFGGGLLLLGWKKDEL
jgi:hypothetical protein